jgi:hypothetical protein
LAHHRSNSCFFNGRLPRRSSAHKWVNVHTHEVYFRDTAHGFLVWCVGLVITASFLASAAAVVAGGPRVSGMTAATTERPIDPNAYFVDSLFRSGKCWRMLRVSIRTIGRTWPIRPGETAFIT